MNDEERYELARLLSRRDAPSVLEEEEGLSAVVRGADPTQRSGLFRRGRRAWAVTGMIAVAAAALFVVQPREATPPPDSTEADFGARGAGSSDTALELACTPGPQCRVGSALRFRLRQTRPTIGYFSAFARAADGTVIWYLPADDVSGSAPFTSGDWLTHGVRIGPEHSPGEYTVYGFVSPAPLSQDAIRTLFEGKSNEQVERLQVTLKVHR